MKVLAIDPGFDRCGVAILEKNHTGETLLFSDCITTDKSASLIQRLYTVGEAVSDIITRFSPDTVAIETLFFNKNITTAIAVAEVRGILLFIAKKNNCTIYEFGPQEIKVAVTGYGKSDKRAVYDMVRRLVKNVPPKAHDDEYDAIAVGITCLAHYGRQGR